MKKTIGRDIRNMIDREQSAAVPAGRPMHPKALKHWVGERVEIPTHYDAWMRGARFGLVTSVAPNGLHVNVLMDHPQIRRTVKVAVADLPLTRILRLTRKVFVVDEEALDRRRARGEK